MYPTLPRPTVFLDDGPADAHLELHVLLIIQNRLLIIDHADQAGRDPDASPFIVLSSLPDRNQSTATLDIATKKRYLFIGKALGVWKDQHLVFSEITQSPSSKT